MTWWAEFCIVTDSLGAFCPSFDSWEQAGTVTRVSHVSVFGRIIIIRTNSKSVRSLWEILTLVLGESHHKGKIPFVPYLTF